MINKENLLSQQKEIILNLFAKPQRLSVVKIHVEANLRFVELGFHPLSYGTVRRIIQNHNIVVVLKEKGVEGLKNH